MSDVTEAPTETTDVVEGEPVEVVEGETALGDPGKKALDAMKAQRKAAIDEAKSLRDELAAIKAQAEGREAEHAAEVAKRAARDEALSLANQRILKSELKAAATGKLADPTDAHLFIDLSEFTVSDDGDVDSAALGAAIADLIARKPHLAAGKQARFDGSADQGGKRADAPGQLSKEEFSALSPEDRIAAYEAGQVKSLMGG